MSILFILLILAPFLGAFQVFYALGLAIFHPNRDNLMPHLSRYGMGVALYFLTLVATTAFPYSHFTAPYLWGIFALAAIGLAIYNFWIMFHRNEIGKERSETPAQTDPFCGADNEEDNFEDLLTQT